jgi:uncharacterized protein with WD repeat
VQAVDGGAIKELADLKSQPVWSFAWSPNGKQFAYACGNIFSDVVLISNFL